MNKIIAVTLLALMALTPIALAQEANETELEVMHTPVGALLRFVQLDRQIELRLIRGNAIVQAMNELSIANTSVLTDILDELKSVQDTVKTYTVPVENVNLTKRAEAFVDLKTDSVELVSSFKNETKLLLTNVNMSEFNARIRIINENTTKINELSNKVRDYIKEYNAERINKTLRNLGIKNESLIENARNGTLKQDLKNQLRSNYEQLRNNTRQAILSLKEELAKERIENRQLRDKLVSEYKERQLLRLNTTIANLTRLKDKIQSRIGGNQ